MGMIGYYFRADEDLVNQIKSAEYEDVFYKEDFENNLLDVDKSWHAIHFVLTGQVWDAPDDELLSHVVMGGQPLEDMDMGYGPARLLERDLVKNLAEALDHWDEASFREKFHVKDMIENQVYPVMDNKDEEDFFEYVWFYFLELKNFFKEAADRNEYIISYIA
ncbi:MAG: YfbM family protein [Hungatella sp.]|nr:YfbM family protein [Hungatella sp.]